MAPSNITRKMRPASCTVCWMLVLQLVSSVAAVNISLPTDPLASLLAWPLPGTVFTWGDTVNYRVDQASCSGATISAYETAGSNLSIGLTTLSPCNGTVDTPLAPLNSGRYNFVIKVVGSSNVTSAAKDTSTDSISYAVLNPSVWEAENTDALNGTTLKNQTTLDVSGGLDLAGITNGTSVRYDGWNLYNIDSITVRASSGMATPLQSLGSFEVRVNSPTGRRIARGDIAGTGNWSTYRDFTVGVFDTNQYFILDFGVPTTVSKLLLNSTGSPGDYPRSYIIFVSDDGRNFGSDSVLSGKGDSSLVTITFPAPVTTRFIKIVQAGASEYQWWSIHEMYALDGQGALLDRSGWAASASSSGSQLTESMAFDGNLTSKWGSGETQRSGVVSLHFVFLAKGTPLPATELFRINRITFGGQGIAVNPKPQTGNFTLPYTFNVNTSSVAVFTDPLAVFSNSSAAAPTSIGVANATAAAITMLPNGTANGTMAGAITMLPNGTANGTTAGAITVLPNSAPNGTAGNASIAINCGSGLDLTLSDGTVFAADNYFVGGMMLTNLLTFTGTADQALYQKERYGAANFSYQIPVPSGSYVVSIFEAETVFNASLKRVFDVFINGREEISALDVFNATGGNHRALVLTRTTSVTTGLLNVLFSPLVGEAKVSGLSVAPYVPGKNVTVLPGRLEAENYRAGGQGIGYSDFSKGNAFGDDARLNNCTNGDDVDVGAALDVVPGKGVEAGCMVGMILPHEWLQYDVTFATAGLYSITFRTASNSTNPKQAHLEVDGADITGPVVFPAMGSWQIFSDSTVVTKTVISAGPHLVRLVFDSGDVNFNYIDFKLQL